MRQIILSKPFIKLFLMNFFFFASLNVLYVLPDYLEGIGASKPYIAMFMNVNSLLLVLLVAPLSLYTDRIGRKRLLLGTYVLAILSFAGMFWLSTSLPFLAVFKLAGTLLFCAAFTIHGVEAFELLPRQYRVAGMAIYGISGLASNPVASFLGEMVLLHVSARAVFLLALGLTILALLVTLTVRFHSAPPPGQDASFLSMVRRPQLRSLLITCLVMGGGFAVFATFLANLTSERLGIVNISAFFTASSIVAVSCRLSLPFILKRFSLAFLAVASMSLMALSYFLALVFSSLLWLPIMGAFFGVSIAIMFPLLSTLLVNSGRDEEKLGLSNLFAATVNLGNIGLSVLFGLLGSRFGTNAMFLAMGLCLVACLPLAWSYLSRQPQVSE